MHDLSERPVLILHRIAFPVGLDAVAIEMLVLLLYSQAYFPSGPTMQPVLALEFFVLQMTPTDLHHARTFYDDSNALHWIPLVHDVFTIPDQTDCNQSYNCTPKRDERWPQVG